MIDCSLSYPCISSALVIAVFVWFVTYLYFTVYYKPKGDGEI